MSHTRSQSSALIATPADICRAAARKWPTFIDHWVRGAEAALFPLRLRVRVKPTTTEESFVAEMASAVRLLKKHSKAVTGRGYTVHFIRRRSRDWGEQDFPDQVTIDTAADLIQLLDKRDSFERTQQVCATVRAAFPELESWLIQNAKRLEDRADVVDSLVAVCQALRSRPLPDCYIRELNVPVDTKFVEKHATTLRQWLDRVLPPSAIRAEELGFARRYGLRDGLPHHLLRVLDPELLGELGLPFDEFSLPMHSLAKLPVHDCTVIIVENRTNLLTLPRLKRCLAMGGVGDAATRLRDLPWLRHCRLIYWGDLDVDGFRILRNMRSLFPGMKSLLMDAATLIENCQHIVPGNGKSDDTLLGSAGSSILTPAETAALKQCSDRNQRLEQEKIPQPYVLRQIAAVLNW